jgi:hypothetical protein
MTMEIGATANTHMGAVKMPPAQGRGSSGRWIAIAVILVALGAAVAAWLAMR